MKRINLRFASLLFVFMLMAALVLSVTPIEARALARVGEARATAPEMKMGIREGSAMSRLRMPDKGPPSMSVIRLMPRAGRSRSPMK